MNSFSSFSLGLCVLVGGNCYANDGALDASFGTNGVARSGVSDVQSTGFGLAVQLDGKTILCSARTDTGGTGADFFLARFNTNGSLDTTFSVDGRVTIDFNNGNDFCNALAIQSDGKIVAAGYGNNAFEVTRLNSDGTLDLSFGGGTGKALVNFDIKPNGDDEAQAVALQSDGKIVLAGIANDVTGFYQMAVARLSSVGSLDPTFNVTGKLHFSFALSGSDGDSQARAVAVDTQGRIVIGGTTSIPMSGMHFAVARLLSDGSFDPNFDADGKVNFGFGLMAVDQDSVSSMLLQRDGCIVLSGISNSASNNADFSAARLLSDGTLDSTFGVNGKKTVAFDLSGDATDYAWSIAEQQNGKLILVGFATETTNSAAAAARLNRDGSLDPTFGSSGKAAYDFGITTNGAQVFYAAAIDGSRLYAAGYAQLPQSGTDAVMTRIDTGEVFSDSFE